MDEVEILSQLPKAILTVLKTSFADGNILNDYKVVGNRHGLSITLHLILEPQAGTNPPPLTAMTSRGEKTITYSH